MVIGFPKCGTTDLYYKMLLHPDIMEPRSKEPFWYNRLRMGKIEILVDKEIIMQVHILHVVCIFR